MFGFRHVQFNQALLLCSGAHGLLAVFLVVAREPFAVIIHAALFAAYLGTACWRMHRQRLNAHQRTMVRLKAKGRL